METGPTSPHERTALRGATFALLAAAAYVASPLAAPLFLAAWTALLAHPLLVRLDRLPGGRKLAAALLTLAVVALLVVPSVLLVGAMIGSARGVAKALAEAGSVRAALEALMANGAAGAGGFAVVPEAGTDLADLARRYGAEVLALGSRFAAGLSRAVVDVFVYLAGVFFLLLEGESAWHWVTAHTPLKTSHMTRLGAATRETAHGLLLGVGLTTAAQALVATVAYAALGVPRAWALGPLTGLASVVPIVGSALVWVPVAAALFLAGATTKALVLAVVGVALIGTIDNVLRPFFSKLGALDLHVFVLVVAIFGGLSTLGAIGAILGPLVARLTVEALALYREEHLDEGA